MPPSGMHATAAPSPPLQRLPITLPELVEAAPSVTADSSVIVGSRTASVFVLDKHSGRLVWAITPKQGSLEAGLDGRMGSTLGA